MSFAIKWMPWPVIDDLITFDVGELSGSCDWGKLYPCLERSCVVQPDELFIFITKLLYGIRTLSVLHTIHVLNFLTFSSPLVK